MSAHSSIHPWREPPLLRKLCHCMQVAYPFTQTNLRPLTGLTKLQSLIIEAPRARLRYLKADDAGMRLAAQEFPGRLRSLTELSLPLNAVHDISSVSECVGLCDLRLLVDMHPIRKWGAHEWAALAPLTSLTCLVVELDFGERHQGESEAFYGVLRQLKGLRSVGAAIWGSTCLHVLQSLTQLTTVCGFWYFGAPHERNPPACPHIKELGRMLCAPFQAFPGLVSVKLEDAFINDIVALSRHCTGLQRLSLGECCRFVRSHADSAEVLSAFRSLAHLQHLTHLELLPPGDAELVAFTSAASAVSTPQLHCLHVRGQLTIHALMQLHCVRRLKELCVHVSNSEVAWGTFSVEAVRMWLVGLAVVPKVCLVLQSAEQQGVFDAAKQWAAEMELPLPAVLKVSRA